MTLSCMMKNATFLGIVALALTKEGCNAEVVTKSTKAKSGKVAKAGKMKSAKSAKTAETAKTAKAAKTAETAKTIKSAKTAKSSYDVARPPMRTNPCEGANPGMPNVPCTDAGVLGQSGTNVTMGYTGNRSTDLEPQTEDYIRAGMCAVNVHWHLGSEHLSTGEYDEAGSGPSEIAHRRRLAGKATPGFQCSKYDSSEKMYTRPYHWKHCQNMEVGQTYEVHWPHSAYGACGTPDQFQTPFKDGVFCLSAGDNAIIDDRPLNKKVGVQAQVFTVVNDEAYYYPDLVHGMIKDGDIGSDIAYYTGSTTGTSVSNEICSVYAPITWQVDRKCNLISASTFDKMCADMKSMRDDMTDDLHPHGSRELVSNDLAADNHKRRITQGEM